MRSQKITRTIFLVLLVFSMKFVSANVDPFQNAILDAKRENLTRVNAVGKGVPFYSTKTLDPNWNDDGSTPIVKIEKFNFIDQNKLIRTNSIFEGKLSFVTFFFSSCAGFCPMLLKNLQQVENKIKAKYGNVQFVAISVDPEVDQPERLKAYIQRMKLGQDWILLTGDRKSIYSFAHDTLAAEAFALPKSKGQYAHSEHFYVIDQRRRLRGILKGTRLDVVAEADALLKLLEPRGSEGSEAKIRPVLRR